MHSFHNALRYRDADISAAMQSFGMAIAEDARLVFKQAANGIHGHVPDRGHLLYREVAFKTRSSYLDGFELLRHF